MSRKNNTNNVSTQPQPKPKLKSINTAPPNPRLLNKSGLNAKTAKISFNSPRAPFLSKSKPLPPIPNKDINRIKHEKMLRDHGGSDREIREDMQVYDAREKKEEQSLWDMFGDALNLAGRKALKYGMTWLSGFGDYQVNTNSLLAAATEGKNGYTVPLMANSKVGTIIRHREYVADVPGSVLFSNTAYAINPGLSGSFPWCSPVANCYQNYRMRGAMFEFVSLASETSTVQSLGYVVMATQYNSLQSEFVDKKTMENSEYSNSCKASENMCHPLECAPNQIAQSELYVRNAAPPANADLRLYDMGIFNIATGGQVNTTPIGELWLTYELELYFPQLSGTNQVVDVSAYSASTSSWTNSNPIGIQVAEPGCNVFPAVTGSASTTCTLDNTSIGKQYRYVFFWQSNGGGITFVPPTVSGAAGTDTIVSAQTFAPFSGALVTTYGICAGLAVCFNQPLSFTFAGGTLPTYGAGFNGKMSLTQVPNTFTRLPFPEKLLSITPSEEKEDECEALKIAFEKMSRDVEILLRFVSKECLQKV